MWQIMRISEAFFVFEDKKYASFYLWLKTPALLVTETELARSSDEQEKLAGATLGISIHL